MLTQTAAEVSFSFDIVKKKKEKKRGANEKLLYLNSVVWDIKFKRREKTKIQT